MQISCKSCHAPIPAEDVNLDNLLAKCRECDAVFGIAEQAPEPRPRSRGEVGLPASMKLEQGMVGFAISRRWWSPKFIFLLVFCVVWNGFLVFWYSMAFGTADAPLIMKLFPIGHVMVGLFLAWFVLAGFLNKTTLAVSNSLLTVRHRPVPWPGGRTIESSEVDQVYCKERAWSRSSRGHSHAMQLTYSVHAIMRDGRKVKLLSGLDEIEQALFVEQALEEHLGIEDRPVAGEIAR